MKGRDALRSAAAVASFVVLAALASIVAAGENSGWTTVTRDQAKAAVVRIGGCSGVCVSDSGIVLTARHCRLAKRVPVYFADREPVMATLLHVGPDAEDALVYDCDGDGHPHVPIAESVPQPPSAVWSAGYPSIDGKRIFRTNSGKMLGGSKTTLKVNGVPKGDFLANNVDFVTGPGWSGGPLFDERNHVVGLLTSGDKTGSSYISFAATKRAATHAVEQPEGDSAVAIEKTKLWAFTAKWCGPCREFKRDLARGKWGKTVKRSDDGRRVETEQLEVLFYDIDDPAHLTKLRDVQAVLLKATGTRYQEAVPAFYVPGRNAMQVGYASMTGCWILDTLKSAFTSPATPVPPRPSKIAGDVELGEPEPYSRLRPVDTEPESLVTPFAPAPAVADAKVESDDERSTLQRANDALAKAEAAVAKAQGIADAIRGDPQPAKEGEPASWTLLGLLAGIARFWLDRKAVS